MGHWVETFVCITVPRTLPHAAKLASDFWEPTAKRGWVAGAQKHILVGFTSWMSRTIPMCKHPCCQHQACHPAKLLPSPSQKS